MSSLKQENRSQLLHRCGHTACLLRTSSLGLTLWPPRVEVKVTFIASPQRFSFNNAEHQVFSLFFCRWQYEGQAFSSTRLWLFLFKGRCVSQAPGSSQWFASCNYVAEMIIIVIISLYCSLKGGCYQGMGGIWTLPLSCKNRNGVKEINRVEDDYLCRISGRNLSITARRQCCQYQTRMIWWHCYSTTDNSAECSSSEIISSIIYLPSLLLLFFICKS